jgi:acetylornithine aminotransferase/acetylornithine/N-succinyldiaminopimelate aminotransferase
MSGRMNWQTVEDRYQLQTYSKLPVSIERGQGCYVYDERGKRYLDLYSGHCVTSTGHCHPTVVKAVQDQASKLIFYSNATYSSVRARAVEKLLKLCAPPFYQVFLVNSGAEANENAIKLARAVTGRVEIISTQNAFHGRTYASLSSTGIDHYRAYLNPPVPHHRILSHEQVAGSVSERTAGVLIEPIQSMGGVVEISQKILHEIEQSCRDHGSLLIFDEIQTGIGRTGSFLYSHQAGVNPDITTLAKGIASGYAAGADVVTEEVAAAVKKGDLGSTFGGSPLACAAMEATLEVVVQERLVKNASELGAYLYDRLTDLDQVDNVRGRGLLLGVRFRNRAAKEVQKVLFENKILTGSSNDPQVLRLMPALTLGQKEVDLLVEVLKTL